MLALRISFFSLIIFCVASLSAQQIPIGSWQSHFSYTTANSVEKIGNKIYTAGLHLSVYDIDQNEFSTYSKVNGLSDVNITLLKADASTGYMVVIYNNSNIDLYKDNIFYNIPDIKNLNITGSKRINDIFFRNNFIYLSTDFGIVVVNPDKKEIKETYTLQTLSQVVEVHSLIEYNNQFVAATSNGLYVADVNNPVLQNFANWTQVGTRNCNQVVSFKNALYTNTNDSLFQVNTNVFTPIYGSRSTITRVKTGSENMYVCESGDKSRAVVVMDNNGMLIDSIKNVNPLDVVESYPGLLWIADFWQGLMRVENGNNAYPFRPNSIFDNTIYNLSIYNNDVYVSGGAERSWIYTFSSSGFSRLHNGEWKWYNRYAGVASMDTVLDILDVAIDPVSGHAFAASYGSGLLELNMDNNESVVYKNTPYIQATLGDANSYRLAGLKYDDDKNLWMTNYGAAEQLVVKKKDGSWQKFSFPYSASERTASQIEIDNANQKWMLAPRGIGLYVLNDNNTIDNKNDDQIKKLTTGLGYGNLPNNEVYCLTKDKNGKIWVGTADGIAIFNCPESTFSQEGCDAELKIVKYDLNAGLLFQREAVKTIAVDGANNKWIGTTNGVWLISDDAEKIIHQFNKDNSPLPSNEINKIVVHPVTGVVYIATNSGLISYRGEATDGNASNDDLLVFPNPVPSGYSGTIAIKGLVENVDVRITDVAGQMVYRTKAQGGQAIWNGMTYTGKRPSTGVYYIFVTNSDGSETKVGKFIFNE